MRAYVVALVRGDDGEFPLPMAKGLEGAQLHLTRAEAEKERGMMFGSEPDRWKVRPVIVTMPRPRRSPRSTRRDAR